MNNPTPLTRFRVGLALCIVSTLVLMLGCASNDPDSEPPKAALQKPIKSVVPFQDYPYYSSAKLRPNLDAPYYEGRTTSKQLYSRASGWRSQSSRGKKKWFLEPNGEYEYFDRLNVGRAGQIAGQWEEIYAADFYVDFSSIETESGRSGLLGVGWEFSLPTRLHLYSGEGKPTTIEWWEKGSVYPTWYPDDKRTNPNNWQDVIRATDRRAFTNISGLETVENSLKLPKKGKRGHIRLNYPRLYAQNFVGQDLRAASPKTDFGVDVLPTNSRRLSAKAKETNRPAIFGNTIVVLRSGYDRSIRVLATRWIIEFESLKDGGELRHHWFGFKVFNEGPVVESLRKLGTRVDAKGVPGTADKATAIALDKISESDGWRSKGHHKSPQKGYEALFKKNGEPEDFASAPPAEEVWVSIRLPEAD